MPHIRDVHLKSEVAVSKTLDPDRVIKIAGRFAVDSNDVEAAKITAAPQLGFVDVARDGVSLRQDLRGELVRQMMLAYDDLDIYAEVIRVPEYLDNAPDRALASIRELENFHVDDHAVHVFGALGGAWRQLSDTVRGDFPHGLFEAFRNRDPLLDTVVGSDHEVAAFADPKLADNSDMSPAQYFDDLAFRPAFSTEARYVDKRTIAVHSLGRFGRGKEDITTNRLGRRRIGNEEAEAVAMNRKPAGQVFRIDAGSDEMTGAQFGEQPLAGQPVQCIFEGVTVFTLQVQLADQLFIGAAAMRQTPYVLEHAAIVDDAARPLAMFFFRLSRTLLH